MKRLHQFILVVTALLLFVTGLTAGCRNAVNVSGQGSKTETNVKTANKIDDDKATAEKKIQEEERIKAEVEKAKKETLENAEREKVQIKQKAGNLQYYVFVKKSTFTVYLMDEKANVVKTYNCTLGKNPGQKEKRGDMKTPTGTFYVDEIDDARSWTHDFGDGKGEIKGAYGPWFISLNTDAQSRGAWGGIGIHGTHKPEAMGMRDSEGCIRLRNENVVDLKQYVRVGTKVIIEE